MGADAEAAGTPMSVTDDLMSGAEYLASLNDGRAVYLYGERVADVTTHPAFRNSAASLARLYDALRDPDQRDALTTVDRYGIRTHRFSRRVIRPPSWAPRAMRSRAGRA